MRGALAGITAAPVRSAHLIRVPCSIGRTSQCFKHVLKHLDHHRSPSRLQRWCPALRCSPRASRASAQRVSPPQGCSIVCAPSSLRPARTAKVPPALRASRRAAIGGAMAGSAAGVAVLSHPLRAIKQKLLGGRAERQHGPLHSYSRLSDAVQFDVHSLLMPACLHPPLPPMWLWPEACIKYRLNMDCRRLALQSAESRCRPSSSAQSRRGTAPSGS